MKYAKLYRKISKLLNKFSSSDKIVEPLLAVQDVIWDRMTEKEKNKATSEVNDE